MELKNSTVLITFAGSDLGRNIANHFAQTGATLILCDTHKDRLEHIFKQFQSKGKAVYAMPVKDFTTPSLQYLFDCIEQEVEQCPNVIVNCWTASPLSGLNDPLAERFVEPIAQTAAYFQAAGHVAAQRMRAVGNQGVIVNVLSYENHSDTKGIESIGALVSGLTSSWAKEMAPYNIRVGGVIPAPTHQGDPIDSHYWACIQQELTRNAEYIVTNDYFSGRVVNTDV
ncbi:MULTISPECIES: SDR family oxidoreductase [unclassified Vibrio]|uniref:SDR family oxidoreductase n=1 Tax=Vibrio sp. HB236076 TaxID=3232307 RepID=A0AB39HDU7_9VIBR|nr:SDR family oxidoreductase [Vibrio sp. HB161653]MDP5253753.1 SDR family oxidoreductase [Vibrio sp. HB161653]